MSEEQREWKQQLANSREDLEIKVDDILQELARNIAKIPVECSAKRVEAGVQTDKVDVAFTQPTIAADNNNTGENEIGSPFVNGVMVNPPPRTSTSIIGRPLPEDAELLRAELAAVSTQIIEKESFIRSLQQSCLSLRETLDGCNREREELVTQLRMAEAQEFTHRAVRERIGLDLERATLEVQRLRDTIFFFHQPSSRPYQSVKDAVLREMRGEPPITPLLLKRTHSPEGPEAEAERSHKVDLSLPLDAKPYTVQRQKSMSTSPVRPQRLLSIEAPLPHRSATLPGLPRLATDMQPYVQTRTSPSAGGLINQYGGQPPSADRPSFNHAAQSAGANQPDPRFVYTFHGSPVHEGYPRPQDPSVFTRPIPPPQGAAQRSHNISNPGNSSHEHQRRQMAPAAFVQQPPVSAPLPAREQHGQSHSRSRSGSSHGILSHGHPTPNLNPNLSIYRNLPQFPSQEAFTRYLQSNLPGPQHPISPGLALPAGWQANNVQQTRVNEQPPRPNPQYSGLYQQAPQPPWFNQVNTQPFPQQTRPNPQPIQRQALSLSTGPPFPSPTTQGGVTAKPNRPIPTNLTDPGTGTLCLLLYTIDKPRRIMHCKICLATFQLPTPPGGNMSEAFMHSVQHTGEFDAAYEQVFPPSDNMPRSA